MRFVRSMPLIVFSHANSFPSGAYGTLFRSLRARGFTVKAVEHFRHKRVFARWHPRVLADYVEHGTRDEVAPGGVARRTRVFDRDVETAIYNTLPYNLDRLLRRHPLRCPVAFIGGTRSKEMQQVGMTMTRRVVGRDHPERFALVEGGHLFPMERPKETALAIDAMLATLSRSTGTGSAVPPRSPIGGFPPRETE